MYFQVYQDKQGEWRWRLKAANHEIIASGEGYTTKQSCFHCVQLVMGAGSDTPIKEI